MNIGLIGPPGSGKTSLAQRICDQVPGVHSIVDDYIKEFQDQTDLAVARYGSYIVNMQIAIVRLNKELEAKKLEKQFVSCGTLIDSSIYSAMNATEIEENPDGTFDLKVLNDMRTFSTLYWFALLRQDSWNYDHTFYLPAKDGDPISLIFDQSISDALKTFRVESVRLDGTIDEQTSKVVEVINEATDRSTA